MAKPNYTKSTATRDLEERQKAGYVSPSVLGKGVDPGTPSDNGYVNVDPVYQNHANATEQPYKADGGSEAKAEETVYAEDADFTAGATPEGESADEDEPDEESSSSNTPTGGITPPSFTS